MSLTGWSTSNALRLSSAVVTSEPLTMACWFRTSVIGSTQSLVSILASSSSNDQNSFRMTVKSGNTIGATKNDTGTNVEAVTTSTISANTWMHSCAVYESTTSRSIFLNGGNKGTNTTSKGAITPNRTSIGFRDNASADQPFAPSGSGQIAEIAIWSAALTDDEVVSLSQGFVPKLIRPQNLVYYVPGVRDIYNTKDNTSIMLGTLTAADHCRIIQ